MLASFAVSSAAIFMAELGDKSQLLAMSFATRYRWWQVLAGISIATTVVHAASVGVGVGLGHTLPTAALSVLAGLAFIGFALWTLRGDELDESDRARVRRSHGMAVLAVTGAFAFAELGDKTMLATVTLATNYEWFGTWVGSTVGMVVADALAVVAGLAVGRHVPKRLVRYVAALLFAAFGVWTIIDGVMGIQ